MDKQFYEFAIILTIAARMGAVGRLLRQPLIVTFIAVGICVGPAWLGIIMPEMPRPFAAPGQTWF